MRAVIYTKYGPPEVLQLRDMGKPVPADHEILVKVHATTVSAGDVRIRRFNVPFWEWLPSRIYLGLMKPKRKIPGLELAGDIDSVGKKVTRFRKGNQVFAFAGFNFGAYAEYICLPENGMSARNGLVSLMPSNISYEEAAAATGGALTALGILKKVDIKNGQKVLIYGASGSIGTFAIQLAKHFGAEVTGVSSTVNLELIKSLGADKVIDYTKEDFTQKANKYDVIFDAVGKTSRFRSKKSLCKNGVFLSVNSSVSVATEDMEFIKKLLGAGKLKSVIDRKYSLEQIVDAHRYVEKGHKKGNVVIVVKHNHET